MLVMKWSHKIIKLIDESDQKKELNRHGLHCFFPIDMGNRMEFEVSKITSDISLLRGKREL